MATNAKTTSVSKSSESTTAASKAANLLSKYAQLGLQESTSSYNPDRIELTPFHYPYDLREYVTEIFITVTESKLYGSSNKICFKHMINGKEHVIWLKLDKDTAKRLEDKMGGSIDPKYLDRIFIIKNYDTEGEWGNEDTHIWFTCHINTSVKVTPGKKRSNAIIGDLKASEVSTFQYKKREGIKAFPFFNLNQHSTPFVLWQVGVVCILNILNPILFNILLKGVD